MKAHKRDKGRLAGNPRCPVCDTKLDGFTGIKNEKATPKDGDISICAYCGTPLVAKGQGWEKMEGALLAKAMQDNNFRLAIMIAKAFRKEHEV